MYTPVGNVASGQTLVRHSDYVKDVNNANFDVARVALGARCHKSRSIADSLPQGFFFRILLVFS